MRASRSTSEASGSPVSAVFGGTGVGPDDCKLASFAAARLVTPPNPVLTGSEAMDVPEAGAIAAGAIAAGELTRGVPTGVACGADPKCPEPVSIAAGEAGVNGKVAAERACSEVAGVEAAGACIWVVGALIAGVCWITFGPCNARSPPVIRPTVGSARNSRITGAS